MQFCTDQAPKKPYSTFTHVPIIPGATLSSATSPTSQQTRTLPTYNIHLTIINDKPHRREYQRPDSSTAGTEPSRRRYKLRTNQMQQVTSLSLGLDRISTYMYTLTTLRDYASLHEYVTRVMFQRVDHVGRSFSRLRSRVLTGKVRHFTSDCQKLHQRGDQGLGNQLPKIFEESPQIKETSFHLSSKLHALRLHHSPISSRQ